jgi:hypothetical protein
LKNLALEPLIKMKKIVGGTMTKKLLLFSFLMSGLLFSQATDLFISEYIEGSSNNKAVEIFNGTGADVDLSDYELWRVSNGGTWAEATLSLSGTLADGDVYVIANASANASILAVADITNGIVSWNGDDAVGLAKSGVLIDAIGEDGADPGSGWDVAGVTDGTANRTLIRKSTIISPNTNWASSAGTDAADSEWTVNATDFVADLGSHTFNGGGGGNDTDSEIYDPAVQIAATSISSLIDTQGEAVNVFAFTIEDLGTSDGLATIVTGISLKPAPNNTADWTDHIQGVTVDAGGSVTIGSPTITDVSIFIPISAGNLSVGDGSSQEVTVAVYLNAGGLTDGAVLSFAIDGTVPGFTADATGSSFATPLLLGDVNSNDFTIDVEASKIGFTTQPTTVAENAVLSPSVVVSYLDANDNVDVDYDGLGAGVTLTTTGTFAGSATTTADAVLGQVTFDNLLFSAAASNITLTASDDIGFAVIADVVSNAFNVVAAGSGPQVNDVIINEYDAGGFPDFNEEAVELLVVNGPVDMRNWTLREDSEGQNLVFADDPVWSAVPTGTYIVVYVRGSSNASEDVDSGDRLMVVKSAGTYISGSTAFGSTNEAVFLFSGTVSNENAIDGINFGQAGQQDYGLTVPDVGDVSTVASFANGQNFNNDNVSDWTVPGTRSLGAANPGQDDSSLPVEMVSFAAVAGDRLVQIRWETASEKNNLGFILKRATAREGNYNQIASYETHEDELKGLGTSGSGKKYSFTDNSFLLQNGTTYFYKLYDVDYDGVITEYGQIVSATPRANEDIPGVVHRYELGQNYPNPFNPATVIRINLANNNEMASLKVYDATGKLVKVLHNGVVNGFTATYSWDGTDRNGQAVASGVYFYEFKTPNFAAMKKMIFLK